MRIERESCHRNFDIESATSESFTFRQRVRMRMGEQWIDNAVATLAAICFPWESTLPYLCVHLDVVRSVEQPPRGGSSIPTTIAALARLSILASDIPL